MVNVEDNKKSICVDLAEIYNKGTWKEDFGDFGDYTMTMFNITKSTASRMRRVAEKEVIRNEKVVHVWMVWRNL